MADFYRRLYKLTSLLRARVFNRPFFATPDVKIGRDVIFGKNVRFNCQKVRIGDGVIFQDNITISTTNFEIGDFGTIYAGCFFPGPGNLKIGHNFWLGTMSIIDSQGGTEIGNNVGIGAHSQLWTHIKFGDVMAGCRFNASKPLIIGDDVWLVGHVLVSPVTIGHRAMAMLGSVVVSDIPPDKTFAGAPARDFTSKFGPQFEVSPLKKRVTYLKDRIESFAEMNQISNIWDLVSVTSGSGEANKESFKILFNVSQRTYTKTGSELERRLIRHLLPESKFVPC